MSFGVYVHVPFCTTRCDYCDFATWTDRAHLVEEYVEACVVDVHRRFQTQARPPATSVFFGGGTPSLLPTERLIRVLDAIPRHAEAEVTVECNPDSVDARKLRAYRRAGVTRLSFGVQSMRPHLLQALGRTHDPDNVGRAIAWAFEAGFDRINVDLIYGTTGESADDWEATLDDAIALGVGHVSAYALTVEPATPLGRRVASGEQLGPDDDDQADKYAAADSRLTASGLSWYEISNWARPGHECRHNFLYWSQGDYLGIGAAAHGHDCGRRWWNVRTPERYIERVAAGRSPESGSETLDAAQHRDEGLSLALRTRAGAAVSGAAGEVVDLLAERGLILRHHGRVVLTRAGRLLATEVTARLLAAGAADERPGLAHEIAAGTRYT